MGLNQPTPPLERRRIVVPYRAQPCRQAANVVLLLLGFPQTHDVADGVKHLVQERVLQCIVGLAVRDADRLGFADVILQVVQFTDVVLNSCGTLFSLSF